VLVTDAKLSLSGLDRVRLNWRAKESVTENFITRSMHSSQLAPPMSARIHSLHHTKYKWVTGTWRCQSTV